MSGGLFSLIQEGSLGVDMGSPTPHSHLTLLGRHMGKSQSPAFSRALGLTKHFPMTSGAGGRPGVRSVDSVLDPVLS